MTNLLGTDVSFYEDDTETARHIDFVKMKAAGVGFTIVRAGQNVWKDRSFDQSWFDSKAAGLPRGSYFFYDSRVTPQVQAQLWFDTLHGDYGELPLFPDFEESYGGPYKGGAYFKIFLEELRRLMPGKEIVIYTGYWYWKENVSTSLNAYFSQYPLWIAYYGTSAPSIPAPWTDWLFWQYTDKGAASVYGAEGDVDMNYFNGDADQFKARFGLADMPDPATEEKDILLGWRAYFDGATYQKRSIITAHGMATYHVVKIDVTKADLFVSPQVSSRMYVPDYLRKYGLDVAINGDGFISTTIAGFASSEGKPYGRTGQEATIYISKENQFSKVRPASLWNAISYPNELVRDGAIVKINKTLDDVRARSAFGYTKDQKTMFIVAVDGQDYWSTAGLNFPEVAQILINLGCDTGVMLDGGGSTTLAINDNGAAKVINVPWGEDPVAAYGLATYDLLNMRRVANILGVRMKSESIPTIPTTDEGENTMPYQMTTISNNTRIRSASNVYADVIQSVAAKIVVAGSSLWTAPADGSEVKKGDQWLLVTHVNGNPIAKPSWMARIHKGVAICDNFKDTAVVVEPPAPTPAKTAKMLTITYDDNSQEVYDVVKQA